MTTTLGTLAKAQPNQASTGTPMTANTVLMDMSGILFNVTATLMIANTDATQIAYARIGVTNNLTTSLSVQDDIETKLPLQPAGTVGQSAQITLTLAGSQSGTSDKLIVGGSLTTTSFRLDGLKASQ